MKNLKTLLLWSVLVFFLTPYSTKCFDYNQMQNIQQELEEANRAIEEYISSLPADEQAEFNRMVDEVSQMFDNMSEEEFSTFLNEMFTEEPMNAPTETFAPSPQPMVEAAPVLTAEQKKKVDNIITVINDVIRQSNIFLVQVNSSLEAEKNIQSWGKKGTISHWQPNATWNDLKIDIEKFVQQLYKLEDKDLATGEYKYILDLIADEATLNNLIQLQTNLNSSIPHIEISELDIQSLSSQAKTAIKNTLQYYTEAFYMLQLPTAFETIFEKFSPKAEKYREAEEAAEKKAAEAAKRQRTPAGATAAGMVEETGYGYGYEPSYGGYDYGTYGGDYGFPSDYYGGSYGGDYGGGFGEGEGKQGGGAGSRMGGGGAGSAETTAKEGEKKTQPSGPGVAATITKNPIIKQLIRNTQTGIEEIAKIVKEDSLFETLDKHIVGNEDTDPVNTDLANEIADLYKKIHDLTPEVESLQSMVLKTNSATQAYYSKSFAAATDTSVSTITSLKNTLTKINFKTVKSKMSPEKQWAYLNEDDSILQKIKKGEVNPSEKIEDLKEKVKTRVSLADLLDVINKFDSAVNKIKKQATTPTTGTLETITPATPMTPTIEELPSGMPTASELAKE